ncbi:MAG: transposase [Thermaceae bacterium]|nr:transposase [Thermaceae bacterium]
MNWYNHQRPHKAIGYQTPVSLLAQAVA